MNLLLRHALEADAPALAKFNVALALESEGLKLQPEIVLAGVQALLTSPGHGFYVVAQDGEKVIGMTMITFEWSDWRNKVIWWLQSVYVDPAFRRAGVFTKIYHYLHDLAARDGRVECLRLYAEGQNKGAHRTYRKLGMERTAYQIFDGPLR